MAVMIHIKFQNESGKYHFDIEKYSCYPQEKEILLADGLKYKVESVQYSDENFVTNDEGTMANSNCAVVTLWNSEACLKMLENRENRCNNLIKALLYFNGLTYFVSFFMILSIPIM